MEALGPGVDPALAREVGLLVTVLVLCIYIYTHVEIHMYVNTYVCIYIYMLTPRPYDTQK